MTQITKNKEENADVNKKSLWTIVKYLKWFVTTFEFWYIIYIDK